MLQIDHIYTFLFENIFKDFAFTFLPGGVPVEEREITWKNFSSYCKADPYYYTDIPWMFVYDQEPLLDQYYDKYINFLLDAKPSREITIIVSSEKSKKADGHLYYFYHGFAALDWFRGYHALNHSCPVVRKYDHDYISFNRIVTGDRAYRQDFVKRLKENDILGNGAVSYGVLDSPSGGDRLVIDQEQLPGSASASIPRKPRSWMNRFIATDKSVDAFWHVVTETVFYYDKLHLTEKIFKPIASKQPFMLLAAPGNLEYLRSYGFKTFAGIIDESYDSIKDNDDRIEAVVAQLKWYCDLSDDEKTEIQKLCEPIIEHNFHHFYGKFREIITDELLDNTKKLFDDIGYDDSRVDYATVRKLLTS